MVPVRGTNKTTKVVRWYHGTMAAVDDDDRYARDETHLGTVYFLPCCYLVLCPSVCQLGAEAVSVWWLEPWLLAGGRMPWPLKNCVTASRLPATSLQQLRRKKHR